MSKSSSCYFLNIHIPRLVCLPSCGKSDITAYSLLERTARYSVATPSWFHTKCCHAQPNLNLLFQHLQDVKPLSSIPLLGSSVEDSPQELQGQPGFCLSQSKTTHTFFCDRLDVKQSWLTVLKVAVIGRQCTLNGYDITTNSSTCGISGTVNDESVCTGEECIINGEEVIHS